MKLAITNPEVCYTEARNPTAHKSHLEVNRNWVHISATNHPCKHLLPCRTCVIHCTTHTEVLRTYVQKGTEALALLDTLGVGAPRQAPPRHIHDPHRWCVTLILFCQNDTCRKKALSCRKRVGDSLSSLKIYEVTAACFFFFSSWVTLSRHLNSSV